MFRTINLTLLLSMMAAISYAQSNVFTYQGSLTDGMATANGTFQMQFSLHSGDSGPGNQIGSTITLNSVSVTNGIFSVQLDFTDPTAFDGSSRWLEIAVKKPADPSFVVLTPRHPLTSTPYAIKSLKADEAVNASQLGGIESTDYVLTTDFRLFNERDPLPGSTNYIQNTGVVKPGSFNLIGSGAVTGTLSATQYNIGPNRILSIFDNNLFLGRSAGVEALPGNQNTFFGNFTGPSVSTGNDNALMGHRSGNSLTSGSNNAYFGSNAGSFNDGNNNSFFGKDTGNLNSGISNSTFIGYLAGANAGGFTNAAAIGARAMVAQSNSMVLGSIFGLNGANSDTFVGIGTPAPAAKLHVAAFTPVRVRISSDSNAGLDLRLNNNPGWTVATVSDGGGRFDIFNDAMGSLALAIDPVNNRVGIGTITPDQLLTVNGNASKSAGGTTWAVFSDERLKDVTGHYNAGLSEVLRLQPIRFRYKPDNPAGLRSTGEQIGFSAQAVEKVLPEAVTKSENGYLQMNSDPIIWAMLNAIKQQQTQIESLRSEIDQLKILACGSNPAAEACKEK